MRRIRSGVHADSSLLQGREALAICELIGSAQLNSWNPSFFSREMPRGQGDIHVMYIQIYVIIVCRVNHSAFHHVGCRTDRQFFLAVSWVRFEVPQMPNRTDFSSHLTPNRLGKWRLSEATVPEGIASESFVSATLCCCRKESSQGIRQGYAAT